LEQELLRELGGSARAAGPTGLLVSQSSAGERAKPKQESLPAGSASEEPEAIDLVALIRDGLGRLVERFKGKRQAAGEEVLIADQGGVSRLEQVLDRFLLLAASDLALQEYSQDRELTTHYVLSDAGLDFTMRFAHGQVVTALGPPDEPAEVRLETTAAVLDGMFTGSINALRAAMTGRLTFSGETRLAVGIQQIQDDLKRLYSQARQEVLSSEEPEGPA
jgi:putative sterol carrier protein